MKQLKGISRKDKRTYLLAALAFVLICVLMGVSCFRYYIQVQDTVKTESSGYMQEISKQMAANVSKTIQDNFAVLGTIATVLQNSNAASFEQMQAVALEQQEYWSYKKVMLVDKNGVAYDADGTKASLSSEAYLRDAIVNRKHSMSASQTIDGKECVVFAIPLNYLSIDGVQMSALAASYDLDTFDQMLSMSAFDGKGYAHIVQKDGAVVIRSSSRNALQTGYNILSSLSGARMHGGKTLDAVKTDIAGGLSGQAEFSLNGAREYMTYTPLGTQDWSLLTFVPVAVVNAKSQLLLQITLLLCSLSTLAFAILMAILFFVFYRNKQELEQIAYVDPITGGNTIQRFYELAQERLSASGKPQYALIYTNIEKFKVLNEQFGRNACDNILCGIERGISSRLGGNECMGRLFADNFCILAAYETETALAAQFDEWHSVSLAQMEELGSAWLPFVIEFGVYVIGNDTIPFPHMIDRAKLSLNEAAGNRRGKLRYAIYDEQIRRQLFREKQLEDLMEDALANREFQVYLQPKYHTKSEQIGGAEALVRWQNPAEGLIFPDEFIALFEKNGFVVQLDHWVFEEVCRTLRRWIDEGRSPMKVSVNCSRVHLKSDTFLDFYRLAAAKYSIPPQLIEIELTENAVFEDVVHLSKIIDEIHAVGFGCSMDDFGSGYSSLNLIQDIPVDTLKLDKIFFRNGSRDLQRTESVVQSIVTMAKALSMETVAEGVEERQQVEMLKRLDCDYIQGFFFAKPMPIDQFEQLAFGEQEKPVKDR